MSSIFPKFFKNFLLNFKKLFHAYIIYYCIYRNIADTAKKRLTNKNRNDKIKMQLNLIFKTFDYQK